MLVSSPSPSAALRPSPTSPSSPNTPLSPCSPFPRRLSSTSAPFAYQQHQHYEPSRDPSAASRSYLGRRSSRLVLEELRTALTAHSVSNSPTVPSGDLPCGRMSAGQTSLGGGISASTAAAVAAAAPANAAIFPEASDRPANNGFPVPSSAPQPAPVPAPSSHNPMAGPSQTSLVPPMPASNGGNSGSNKRNSPNDNAAGGTAVQPSKADSDGSQSKRLRPSNPDIKLLPADYEFADTRDLVVLISSMLMELIRFNDKIPLHQGRLTRFHSRSPPRISVQDYLQRLTTHATLSPPILLSMVYYIDRLCALYPAFTVSSLTIHRFLIASATVASKGLSDSFWTNKTYARVGGISMTELALLELEFLFRVEWRIVPQPEVLEDYYQSLVERCEGYDIQPEK